MSKSKNDLISLKEVLDLQVKAEETLPEEEMDLLPVNPNPLIGLKERLNHLSSNQQKFLIAKLHGTSDAAACRAIGILPSNAYRWKAESPDFREAYDYVTQNPVIVASDATMYALNKALSRLFQMLDHPSMEVRRFAIEKIISISGIEKSRVEVEHKSGSGGDLDDLRRQLDELRQSNASAEDSSSGEVGE